MQIKSDTQKFAKQQDVIDWIQSFRRFGIKPGLERIKWILAKLNNPEQYLRIIHVAGTNGKGSTCKMIASVLEANGYNVGLFTSPYIEAFNNRIAINDNDINELQLCAVASQVHDVIVTMPSDELGSVTEFELITVLGLQYFYKQQVDFVVLEVGLGGRLDATNVVTPLVTVITSIGLDHTQILGDNITAIAAEKAGIIKSGIPIISGVKQPEAATVIRNVSAELNSQLYELDKHFHNKIICVSLDELQVELSYADSLFTNSILRNNSTKDNSTKENSSKDNSSEDNLYKSRYFFDNPVWSTKLVATYQADNLAVAMMTLQLLLQQQIIEINLLETKRGLLNVMWEGRFEIIQQSPIVIVDGAHNPEGMKAFISSLDSHFGANKKYTWCVGFLQDKDIDEMLQMIIEKANKIIITKPDNERSAEPEKVAATLQNKILKNSIKNPENQKRPLQILVNNDILKAVATSLEQADEDNIICIAGSLYMISEARKWWTKKGQGLVVQ